MYQMRSTSSLTKKVLPFCLWLSLSDITACAHKEKKDQRVDKKKNEEISQEGANQTSKKSIILRRSEEVNGLLAKSFVFLAADPQVSSCDVVETSFTNAKNQSHKPVGTVLDNTSNYETGKLTERKIDYVAGLYPENEQEAVRLALGTLKNGVYSLIENAPASLAQDPAEFRMHLKCKDQGSLVVSFNELKTSEE